MRKQKRIVNIGGVKIGGDNPVQFSLCVIPIQEMSKQR